MQSFSGFWIALYGHNLRPSISFMFHFYVIHSFTAIWLLSFLSPLSFSAFILLMCCSFLLPCSCLQCIISSTYKHQNLPNSSFSLIFTGKIKFWLTLLTYQCLLNIASHSDLFQQLQLSPQHIHLNKEYCTLKNTKQSLPLIYSPLSIFSMFINSQCLLSHCSMKKILIIDLSFFFNYYDNHQL